MIPGIYTSADLPADKYHADPCDTPSLSSSIARKLLFESPAHARAAHPRLNPDHVRVADEKFDAGNAAHGVFLEGQSAVEVVHGVKDFKTKDAREARDAARARGQIPMLEHQWSQVNDTVTAIRRRMAELEGAVTPAPFRDGLAEVSVIWHDLPTGVLCRARLDFLHTSNEAVDDLKVTTRSANPRSWSRSVFDIGYHVQAEFYCRGVEAITGKRPEFRLVVAELAAPHEVSVLRMAPDVEALARKQVAYALELWRRCLSADQWPGYSSRAAFVQLPAYVEAAWLEVELNDEHAVFGGRRECVI